MSNDTDISSARRWRIVVGLGSCGIASGAAAIYRHLEKNIDPAVIELGRTGCAGLCHREPMLDLFEPGSGKRWTYVHLDTEAADKILARHVGRNEPVEEFLLTGKDRGESVNRYLASQKRIVLENCGLIDPESIEDYRAAGGYEAITKILGKLTPGQVIAEVTASGLRGRGGAGFSTGLKWKLVSQAAGPGKYIICNGDEGDPGAFMDRGLLESDPHRVLEGMLIAGYATGANKGYLYVRAEYPLAVRRIKLALEQAAKAGLLGQRVLGSSFSFNIQLRQGAGAFVCGEETALMQSIEGRRGMPNMRPPFPAQSGLWGHPTAINNVETLANVPWIMRHGAKIFSKIGTERSKGTKVFALAGKIRYGGLVEVPMGISLLQIVEEIGGGSISGKPIKAVQIGGPSGGCIPAGMFETRVDYEDLNRTGAIMGSGGLVVMDDDACMVDIARFFLAFTAKESCGKCTFCRIGTNRMLELLTRITEGAGTDDDLKLLEELAVKVKASSLCGLGQTAPNPVLTALRFFRHEYEAHIHDRKCQAKVCKSLLTYSIDGDKCTGCTACVKACPAKAISGKRAEPHLIDQSKCVRCGACFEVCRFDAVTAD